MEIPGGKLQATNRSVKEECIVTEMPPVCHDEQGRGELDR